LYTRLSISATINKMMHDLPGGSCWSKEKDKKMGEILNIEVNNPFKGEIG
jgi:hypothetical protein